MSTKTNAFNSYETTLNGGITDSATSLVVTANPGPLNQPAYIVLEPDDPVLREVILVSTIAGTAWSSITRGLPGSASGGQAHLNGTVVRSSPVHQQLDDVFTDIDALEAADSGHFGGIDTADHPEATPSVRGFLSSADKTDIDTLTDGSDGEALHTHVHTIASHSDTAGTGSELDTLTDGSNADSLHAHGGAGASAAAIRVERTTGAQTIAESTLVDVVFDTIVDEVDPDSDISYAVGTGLLTLESGWWHLDAGVQWQSEDATTVSRHLEIRQGSTTIAAANDEKVSGGAAESATSQVSTTTRIASSTVFRCRVFYVSSGTEDIDDQSPTFFAAFKIRDI